MLATKRSAGVTPKVNLKECVICMPPPSMNKDTHSGFETQMSRHQKSVLYSSLPRDVFESSKLEVLV